MQETSSSGDTGFVVDWQISEDRGPELDLSTAESEVLLPDDEAVIRARLGLSRRL
jgi:hypothetical protein